MKTSRTENQEAKQSKHARVLVYHFHQYYIGKIRLARSSSEHISSLQIQYFLTQSEFNGRLGFK
jgi:hypothetical protein